MTSERKRKRLRKKARELTTDEVIQDIFGKRAAKELKRVSEEGEQKDDS